MPELDGKTEKMYRGGKICLDAHFRPLWARNVPHFGVAHAMALGVRTARDRDGWWWSAAAGSPRAAHPARCAPRAPVHRWARGSRSKYRAWLRMGGSSTQMTRGQSLLSHRNCTEPEWLDEMELDGPRGACRGAGWEGSYSRAGLPKARRPRHQDRAWVTELVPCAAAGPAL